MTNKILYIEDGDPSSIIAELESQDLNVTHHDPKVFENTILEITDDIDLLLLDFRLSGGSAIFDAPTLAQTIRTQNTTQHKNLPIVLISSEDNISGYYADYTSQDLFDLVITKYNFLENVSQYSTKLKSLINAYEKISSENDNSSPILKDLLNIPADLEDKFSPRVSDILALEKHTTNTSMASSFILNHIVIPSGLLINEDILLARLGISKKSEGWPELKTILQDFQYTGIFSEAYNRWWAKGIEQWWSLNSTEKPFLKRLSATQRRDIIGEIFNITDLEPDSKIEHSKSDYFWTICSKFNKPLDPIDGFEINQNIEPWEDKKYFSLLAVSELESLKEITAIDQKRFSDIVSRT